MITEWREMVIIAGARCENRRAFSATGDQGDFVQEMPNRPSEAQPATIVMTTSASEVRDMLVRLLRARECTVEEVALRFGVNRRTVHRYLAREGHTFSGILDSVRRDLAPRYVGDRRRSLAQVSALLGFATPSSFSRWYRRNSVPTPRRTAGRAHSASPSSTVRPHERPAASGFWRSGPISWSSGLRMSARRVSASQSAAASAIGSAKLPPSTRCRLTRCESSSLRARR